MIDYKKIKLVIWDLDETFWHGTLSEGEIVPNNDTIELVNILTDRGIVNAICSKNDFEATKRKLEELGVWDLFVFNSINWEPKGARIKDLIDNMSLRYVNVLFIDDNTLNLNEAAFYCPDIMTATPTDVLAELIKMAPELGKDDSTKSRLKQYKVLEQKKIAKEKSSSNEEFLKSCDIKVTIHKECEEEIERITELIQRSNQLNYTKVRSSEDEIKEILSDSDYECGFISAVDKYGSYGIIGFYALHILTNSLVHFVFSCRTMGMGIEQFIYSMLNYPSLTIEGEVAVALNKTDKQDWIQLVKEESIESANQSKIEGIKHIPRILFKGPCDTDSSFAFIKDSDKFDTEFTFVNQDGLAVSSHNTTFHALASLSITMAEKEEMKLCNPFWDDALYQTSMFQNNYDIVFFSLFKESISGLYEFRGIPFVHDDWFINATDPTEWKRYIEDKLLRITKEKMKSFSDKFIYRGRISQEDIVKNCVLLREKLRPECLLVLSIPTTFFFEDKEDPRKNDRSEYNKVLGELLRNQFKNCNNVRIIDYSEYANKQKDFLDTSNHFSKEVYYKVAMKYGEIINDWCGSEVENMPHSTVGIYEGISSVKKILRKNKSLVKVVRKIKSVRRGNK